MRLAPFVFVVCLLAMVSIVRAQSPPPPVSGSCGCIMESVKIQGASNVNSTVELKQNVVWGARDVKPPELKCGAFAITATMTASDSAGNTYPPRTFTDTPPGGRSDQIKGVEVQDAEREAATFSGEGHVDFHVEVRPANQPTCVGMSDDKVVTIKVAA